MNDAAPNSILIVDDDAKIRVMLRTYFESENYCVEEAANGEEMRARLQSRDFDVILLDINFPGENGIDLAQEVRLKFGTPIIIVSGKGDVTDKVLGLELGAEDYITKPFHLREVLARVRKVIARSASDDGGSLGDHVCEKAPIQFKGFQLDPTRRTLTTSDGEAVNLTTGEYDLLLAFVQQPGRPLSRDQLMCALKGTDWEVYDRSIDTQVARLRKKIERDPAEPEFIKTVRGVGYIFAENVSLAAAH